VLQASLAALVCSAGRRSLVTLNRLPLFLQVVNLSGKATHPDIFLQEPHPVGADLRASPGTHGRLGLSRLRWEMGPKKCFYFVQTFGIPVVWMLGFVALSAH